MISCGINRQWRSTIQMRWGREIQAVGTKYRKKRLGGWYWAEHGFLMPGKKGEGCDF